MSEESKSNLLYLILTYGDACFDQGMAWYRGAADFEEARKKSLKIANQILEEHLRLLEKAKL